MRAFRVAALILVSTALGCRGNPAVPDEDHNTSAERVPLQTDRQEYVATLVEENGLYSRYGFTLVVEYQNLSNETLWLGRCYPDSETPIYGVEAIDAQEAAYSAAWACVGHDRQFAVPPGGSRVDVLEIRGPNAWGGCTAQGCDEGHHGTLEGRFRLLYDVHLCPGDCYAPAPDDLRVSNEFVVRLD